MSDHFVFSFLISILWWYNKTVDDYETKSIASAVLFPEEQIIVFY